MERMSQDVALSILNTLQVDCIKAVNNASSVEEKEALNKRSILLAYEERVIYEMVGDDQTRDILYDKIDRYYSPEVKAIYGKA